MVVYHILSRTLCHRALHCTIVFWAPPLMISEPFNCSTISFQASRVKTALWLRPKLFCAISASARMTSSRAVHREDLSAVPWGAGPASGMGVNCRGLGEELSWTLTLLEDDEAWLAGAGPRACFRSTFVLSVIITLSKMPSFFEKKNLREENDLKLLRGRLFCSKIKIRLLPPNVLQILCSCNEKRWMYTEDLVNLLTISHDFWST